jgi:hypothetical protein
VVLTASKLPGAGSLTLEHAQDGRVTAVVLGSRRISATDFRRRLGLQSTWFDIGRLSLSAAQTRIRYGNELTLAAAADGIPGARLERRIGAGTWKRLKLVTGKEAVTVEPQARTLYRLSLDGIVGPEVAVDVAPKVQVTPAGADVLVGDVRPKTRGTITVLRHEGSGWRVVAHPRLDERGTFHAPLRLQAGTYRVQVADDGRYAGTTTDVHVTSRLLASLGY